MNTLLDGTAAYLWFPESAQYKDGELRLILAEGKVSNELVQLEVAPGTVLQDLRPIAVPQAARRVLIHFKDVGLLHVIDEVAYREPPEESRESGVVALHRNSSLQRWVSESMLLNEVTPCELFHYSVATAEDVYHVITRTHPTVSEIEA